MVVLCREISRRINELEREISRLVAPLAPILLVLHGAALLSVHPRLWARRLTWANSVPGTP